MKSEDEEKYPPPDTGPSVESMKNEAIEAIEAMVNNSEENTISSNNVENTFKNNISDENNLFSSSSNNPWSSISKIEEFLYFCCPECEEKNQSKELFIKHALEKHPNSKECIALINVKEEKLEEEENNEDEDEVGADEDEDLPHLDSDNYSSSAHISYVAAEYDNYESIVKCELNEEGEEEEEENWTDFTKKLPVTITKNKINKPIRHKVIARPLGESFETKKNLFIFFNFL